MDRECTITWTKAAEASGIRTIEDPLHKTATDKAKYYEVYGAFLDTLDGEDMASYFDFYFESSPLNPSHWVFRDEDSREDFIDGAHEEGCMPTLKEVHEGESKEDKEVRKAEEEAMRLKAEEERKAREARARNLEAQRAKLGEKKSRAKLQVAARKQEQMMKSLQDIRAKLADPEFPEDKKEKLRSKAEKIAAQLEKTI